MYISTNKCSKGVSQMSKKEKIYALYKGENLIADGTIQEIHERTGKKVDTLLFMTCPVYKKRIKNGKNRLCMTELR